MLADFRKVLLAAITLATTPSAFADVITEWNNPADLFALHNVEIIFHQAASTKDLSLMMSPLLTMLPSPLAERRTPERIRFVAIFATVAESFQSQNKWVAYTPAQRIRIDIDRNKAHPNVCTLTSWASRSPPTRFQMTTGCAPATSG